MLAHLPGVTLAEAIVQSLVVGVIETLLLQCPFQVPVNLGHEAETRNALPNELGCLRPEERSALAPGSFEDIWLHEHGHVAAHPVALAGNLDEFPDHGFLR